MQDSNNPPPPTNPIISNLILACEIIGPFVPIISGILAWLFCKRKKPTETTTPSPPQPMISTANVDISGPIQQSGNTVNLTLNISPQTAAFSSDPEVEIPEASTPLMANKQ